MPYQGKWLHRKQAIWSKLSPWWTLLWNLSCVAKYWCARKRLKIEASARERDIKCWKIHCCKCIIKTSFSIGRDFINTTRLKCLLSPFKGKSSLNFMRLALDKVVRFSMMPFMIPIMHRYLCNHVTQNSPSYQRTTLAELAAYLRVILFGSSHSESQWFFRNISSLSGHCD